MRERKNHWEAIYQQKRSGEVSWYQSHLAVSLRLLVGAGLHPESRIIDIGGGASTLVDDLLEKGIRNIAVLDIAGHALAAAKARLGNRAEQVTWLEADITQVRLPDASYDLWHDRAVFHFLTKAEDRGQYLETMRKALTSNGYLILATFALEGPSRCSGLEVVRYSPETLQAEVGKEFKLIETLREEHQTPFNTVQPFLYCRFQKTS